MNNRSNFGCPKCYGDDAAAVWKHALKRLDTVVDDSHFILFTCECPECRQKFLHIFTEHVDWDKGDDKQYWDLLPVTDEEATVLANAKENVDPQYIMQLGAKRRFLMFDDYGARWREGGLLVMPGG